MKCRRNRITGGKPDPFAAVEITVQNRAAFAVIKGLHNRIITHDDPVAVHVLGAQELSHILPQQLFHRPAQKPRSRWIGEHDAASIVYAENTVGGGIQDT